MNAPTWQAPDLEGNDLREAAEVCVTALMPAAKRDWSVLAGDLEWTCRHTIDHVVDALLFYATHLATLSPTRRPKTRDLDPARSPSELLGAVENAGAILASVFQSAPAGARAFHPWGVPDPTGYLGMGCTEILVHTGDVAQGLGVPFRGPDELAAKVIARIFPWAPVDVPAWDAFHWSTGRIALPDRPRQDDRWRWHCAPISEWDGAIARRPPDPIR